jgi:hypothetical protein
MDHETAGQHLPPPTDGDVDIAVDPTELAALDDRPEEDRPVTSDPETIDADGLGGTAGGNSGGAG